MTKSRQSKKKIVGLFLVAFFLLAVFNNSARNFFAGAGTVIFQPFSSFGGSVINWANKGKGDIETKSLDCEILKKENEELKEFLSRPDKKDFIFAYVESRPPQSPYDILVVDMGAENGVQNGMQAVAYDDILIGYVIETSESSSKIKLTSFPNEETNAVLFLSNNQVITTGKGGGNFEIKLPKSIEVNTGERVITIGASPMLLGMIEKIEINPSDPFQKLYFRFPFNLHELKYIAIKK